MLEAIPKPNRVEIGTDNLDLVQCEIGYGAMESFTKKDTRNGIYIQKFVITAEPTKEVEISNRKLHPVFHEINRVRHRFFTCGMPTEKNHANVLHYLSKQGIKIPENYRIVGGGYFLFKDKVLQLALDSHMFSREPQIIREKFENLLRTEMQNTQWRIGEVLHKNRSPNEKRSVHPYWLRFRTIYSTVKEEQRLGLKNQYASLR